MENTYAVATNWAIFGAVAIGGLYYYWPRDERRGDRNREDAQHTGARRQNRGRQPRRPSSEREDGESSVVEKIPQTGNGVTRKRKVQTKEPAQPTPAINVQTDEPEEVDMNTKQWAEQMLQARKGYDLTSTKTKENRVKTVKQSSAANSPLLSSGSDDEASPVRDTNAGDVSDMLEPVASGPASMRITGSSKPQKEKVAKKEEAVETKKQRQNRQKVEERRLQREAEEKDRKTMEEKQRRSAREARGEPARNGMQSSKPPASSAWTAQNATPVNGTPAPSAPAQPAPLLDTFDVESNSSSNGGPGASTAATSTASGGHDLPSEEDQMAQAMKLSEDESGWTTVAQPKKQKKKKTPQADASEPVLTNKTNIQPPKPTTNGKPKGFQALDVEYEQRTDADPNDASNWDA